jgi:hypothetical protein
MRGTVWIEWLAFGSTTLYADFLKKKAKTKTVARVNVKKIKAKKIQKALKSPAMKQRRFFTKICQKWRNQLF